MPNPLIIFDLDGTLANTGPDLLGTLNRITAPFDIEPMQIETLNYVLGQGAMAMIARAFERANKPLSQDLHEELLVKYLADYKENICNETHLYDGVLDAMDRLEDENYDFSVCTNKTESMADLLLEKLGVRHRFKSLTGGDTFEFRKPDALHLVETAKLAGNSIENCIMIGDSKADIGAAINANIPSIAVTFGYSDLPVAELGATKVISHFKELANVVRAIGNGSK